MDEEKSSSNRTRGNVKCGEAWSEQEGKDAWNVNIMSFKYGGVFALDISNFQLSAVTNLNQ